MQLPQINDKKKFLSLIGLSILTIITGFSFYLVANPDLRLDLRRSRATAQTPASYIVWWPVASCPNCTQTEIGKEMDKMIKTYYPHYIYILAEWNEFEPEPNQFEFAQTDKIIEEAKKRNIKVILHITTDAYGGQGIAPFSYLNSINQNKASWFWKHTKPDGTEYGLYDPLTDAMRYPPTCGCNCNNNKYGQDVNSVTGQRDTIHNNQTCDNIEKIPTGAKDQSGNWITKTIQVNEHPDLVYTQHDTAWPGNGDGKDVTIHSPIPSFSSLNYRVELEELWKAVAQYYKENFSDTVYGYNIWSEPSYAHYKEYGYPVDYSEVELGGYNAWRVNQGKNQVSAIPNPPTEEYILYQKHNLASMLALARRSIKDVDPTAKVAFHLFLPYLNNEKYNDEITKIDPEIMIDTIEPDIINEMTHSTSQRNLESEAYPNGSTYQQIYQTVKTHNKTNSALISSSIDLNQEVHQYNVKYFGALYTIETDTPSGGKMPLTNCWAHQNTIDHYGEENTNNLISTSELQSAYDATYSWEKLKGSIPDNLSNNSQKTFYFYIANTGKRIWYKDRHFTLGARFQDSQGNFIKDSRGEIIEMRADWIGGDNKVLPGEQQKFQITIELPPTSGTYTINVDMIEESVTWFQYHEATPYTKQIEVTTNSSSDNDGSNDSNPVNSLPQADLNQDNLINSTDYQLFVDKYIDYRQNDNYDSLIDLNSDQQINIHDYNTFIEEYKQEN